MRITPHSSLDPEQYRIYVSSQSIQAQQTSQLEQPDSGFDESSPISASPQDPIQIRGGIVPDSQSIPNFSSYLPTEIKSSSSVVQASEDDNRGRFIDPRLLAQRELSSVHISADSDPIEDIISSQDLPEHIDAGNRQLSESIVIEDSRRDSRGQNRSSDLHPHSIVSSLEVAALLPGRQAYSGDSASPGLNITSTGARPLVSSNFEPDTQGSSCIVRPSAGTLINDSPNRQKPQPELAQNIPNEHSTDSLTFQTQVPLHFEDQRSELAPESPSTPG